MGRWWGRPSPSCSCKGLTMASRTHHHPSPLFCVCSEILGLFSLPSNLSPPHLPVSIAEALAVLPGLPKQGQDMDLSRMLHMHTCTYTCTDSCAYLHTHACAHTSSGWRGHQMVLSGSVQFPSFWGKTLEEILNKVLGSQSFATSLCVSSAEPSHSGFHFSQMNNGGLGPNDLFYIFQVKPVRGLGLLVYLGLRHQVLWVTGEWF